MGQCVTTRQTVLLKTRRVSLILRVLGVQGRHAATSMGGVGLTHTANVTNGGFTEQQPAL
jgi:hypothetical protein